MPQGNLTLGRLLDPPVDERDNNYPASLLLATAPAIDINRTTKMWRGPYLRLDQDGVGACVAFAGENWRGASPIMSPVSNAEALNFYKQCKAIDGYPNVEGTYDRALMKVFQSAGIVGRYLWARTEAEVRQWVLTTGTVIIGIPWYTSMFDVDADGTLHPTGSIAGGHEVCLRGSDQYRRAYRVRNSWGPNWGLNGEAWLKWADADALIFKSGRGDACCAVQAK